MLFMQDSHHRQTLIRFFGVLIIAGVAFVLINGKSDGTDQAIEPDLTNYERVSLEGTYECLPKKDTGGAVTLECALGLHADNGLYYGMDTTLMATTDFMHLPTGTRIAVEGAVVPAETLSAAQWQTYDMEGIIVVASGHVLAE